MDRIIPPNITFVPIDNMTDQQWFEYRTRGLGASDIPIILGMVEYRSSIELFYEKLGAEKVHGTNLAMIIGKKTEQINADLWEYWGGSEKTLIENITNGTKVRESAKVDCYAHNEKYPEIFASLDRYILPNNNRGYGALELKNTISSVVNKYENGIITPHIIQLIIQIMVTELEYGEVSYLYDNKQFNVVPIEDISPLTDIFNNIYNSCKTFWGNVIKAKPIFEEMQKMKLENNQKKYAILEYELAQYEPPPQPIKAYENFIKEKYRESRNTGISIKGDEQQYIMAKEIKDIKTQINELTKKATTKEIILKKSMGNEKATKIDFWEKGYVQWKSDVNGKITFLNKIK